MSALHSAEVIVIGVDTRAVRQHWQRQDLVARRFC